MILESNIIARVEGLVRHPVFVGSDEVLGGVLQDLERKLEAHQLSPQAYARLREQILGSPHFRDN